MNSFFTVAAVLLVLLNCAYGDPLPSPSPIIADELQLALTDVVNQSVGLAGDAKEFILGQLPDVIKQLLIWKLAANLLWTVILAVTGFILARYLIAWGKVIRKDDLDEIAWLFVGILSIFCVTIFFFAVVTCVEALQIALAPKVYLIEYVKSALGK